MNANEAGDTITSIGKVREKLSVEVLGPCLVSIGSPLVNHIKFMASRVEWSSYKTKYVLYPMHLFSGKKMIGNIGIEQHAQPYMFSPAAELRDYIEPKLSGLLHRAFTYEIYDGTGAVTIGTGISGPRSSFYCKINDITRFCGFLHLSKEETMKLIYSIHVEMSESPTQKQEGSMPFSMSSPNKPNDSNNIIVQLERLAKLKEQGILTEEEFQTQKKKILST